MLGLKLMLVKVATVNISSTNYFIIHTESQWSAKDFLRFHDENK